MAKFVVLGGKKLGGRIDVAGSKNASLPILAATLLTAGTCEVANLPDILDVKNFLAILEALGAKVERDTNKTRITCDGLKYSTPDRNLVTGMRASVVLLGALLSRFGRADVAYPGGDKIGLRPINYHIEAFRALGAKVKEGETLQLEGGELKGAKLKAHGSVTGTENMVLASVLARGETEIEGAACEPHVRLLCDFLNAMGAQITGVGTEMLQIKGVRELHGAKIEIIPDMIEAGTFAVLAAATKSQLIITNVDHSQMEAVYEKLVEAGVSFDKGENRLIINEPQNPLRSMKIRPGLYPQLATDLQPPFGVLATQCEGTSEIHDRIYEGRLGYLRHLAEMGAKVKILNAHSAEVTGPTPLRSTTTESLDIRSGITLVIAALIAEGKSEIAKIHHIDRGYQKLETRLQAIGADIQRID